MAIFLEETGEIIHENSKTGVAMDTGRVDNKTRTKFLCSILTDRANGLKLEPIQKIGKQKVDRKG